MFGDCSRLPQQNLNLEMNDLICISKKTNYCLRALLMLPSGSPSSLLPGETCAKKLHVDVHMHLHYSYSSERHRIGLTNYTIHQFDNTDTTLRGGLQICKVLRGIDKNTDALVV